MSTSSAPRFARFRPNVHLVVDGPHLALIGDKAFRVTDPSPPQVEALRSLARQGGAAVASLEALLGEVFVQRMLEGLSKCGLLQVRSGPFMADDGRGTNAYVRAVLDTPEEHTSFASKSVLVVGCGAVGGEVARHLAAAGVGRLALVDHDRVEASNLNRQYLFGIDDVGRLKVEAARAALLRLSPTALVETFDARIGAEADLDALALPRVDAVVCCADTPPRRIARIVSEYAFRRGALFTTGSVGLGTGIVGPLMRPDAPVRYDEWAARHTRDELTAQLTTRIPSFGPTSSMVSAMLARDLLHVLAGGSAASVGHLLTVHFETLETTRAPID